MHDFQTSAKPNIDDLLKKLDSSLGKASSKIDDRKCTAASKDGDGICEVRRGVSIGDKENSRDDGPNIEQSTKPSLFGLSKQKQEIDKLRTFSVQLQLMHKKGRARQQGASAVDLNVSGSRLGNTSSNENAHQLATHRVSNCRYLVCNSTVGNSVSTEESQHEELVKNALRMASASTKIQSVFKGGMTRSKLARDKLKIVQANKIACAWRGFVARRLLVVKKAEVTQLQICTVAASSIQAGWRSRLAHARFTQIQFKIIKCQSIVRMWLAMRRLCILNQEVSSALTRYNMQVGSERTTSVDVALMQPLATLELQLKAIVALQSKWGVFAVTKCEFKTKEQRVLEDGAATSISAWWRRVYHRAKFTKAVRGT